MDNTKLQYPTAESTPTTESRSQNEKRKRSRNIIWFNPPYSKTVRTNVAGDFLKSIDKHFPKTSPLHKIFNRNTIEVSYSCMRETKSAQESTKDKQCNCRNVNECPLNQVCLTKDLVYKAEVITKDSNERKTYIGMTATTFKDRYRITRNHSTISNARTILNFQNIKLNKKQYKINLVSF